MDFIRKFNESVASAEQDLVVLCKTKKITRSLVKQAPIWGELKKLYKVAKGAAEKAVVTILNAIVTHKRSVFVLSRKTLSRLIQQDPNWNPPAGISNNDYRYVLKLLVSRFCVEERRGAGQRPSVYRVKDLDFLQSLGDVNYTEQLTKTLEFVGKKDGKSDSNQYTEDRAQKLDDSGKSTDDNIELAEASVKSLEAALVQKYPEFVEWESKSHEEKCRIAEEAFGIYHSSSYWDFVCKSIDHENNYELTRLACEKLAIHGDDYRVWFAEPHSQFDKHWNEKTQIQTEGGNI
jgi:hypothetical protein